MGECSGQDQQQGTDVLPVRLAEAGRQEDTTSCSHSLSLLFPLSLLMQRWAMDGAVPAQVSSQHKPVSTDGASLEQPISTGTYTLHCDMKLFCLYTKAELHNWRSDPSSSGQRFEVTQLCCPQTSPVCA